jgi:hypothetical protein
MSLKLSPLCSQQFKGVTMIDDEKVFSVDEVTMDRHRATIRVTMEHGEEFVIVVVEGRAIAVNRVG